ncbi:MAG TPA: hypothetical protein VNW99_00820 [Cytophagaceae bacterium]|jgi:hypothetical protein|nr:hypothetical protein [Cytophagaceae bacterium]
MLLKFEELPENSRVWVYQSNRPMEQRELDYIKIQTGEFISSWESHSTPVPGSFKILYERFLIIAADESGFTVSGCSTDKSVHFIKGLQDELCISFFDRLLMPFKKKDQISFYSMNSLKDLINKGEIHGDQILLNTLVSNIHELNNSFEIRAADSFLAKYWTVK